MNTTNSSINTTKYYGELEIDHVRGVIYFHLLGEDVNDPNIVRRVTILRISQLPRPIPLPYLPTDINMDIIHMKGANWTSQES
jgi:hypothetical protein